MELRSELGLSTCMYVLSKRSSLIIKKLITKMTIAMITDGVVWRGGKERPKWSLFAPNDPHFVAKYRNSVRAVKPNSLSANFHCTETELHFKHNHFQKFDYHLGY